MSLHPSSRFSKYLICRLGSGSGHHTVQCSEGFSEKKKIQINTEVALLLWLQAVVKYKILCHESVGMLSLLFSGCQQIRQTSAKISVVVFCCLSPDQAMCMCVFVSVLMLKFGSFQILTILLCDLC